MSERELAKIKSELGGISIMLMLLVFVGMADCHNRVRQTDRLEKAILSTTRPTE